MSGSTTAIVAIVVVAVVALAVYLLLVRYAAVHPGHKRRRKEPMRGVVQGGQHVGGGRSVMPRRDAPASDSGVVPHAEAPDVEDAEADEERRSSRGQRPASGSPMDL
jgi:hypothetical protein